MQERSVRTAVIGALLCCPLAACSTIPQGYDHGENLRLPAQIMQWPAQTREPLFSPGRQPGVTWQVIRSDGEDNTKSSVWTVTNRGAVLHVLASAHPGPSPEEYVRRAAEEGGYKGCLTETSDTLDSSRDGGVARVLRLTTCTLDDLPEWPGGEHQKRANLQLYIQGRDSHYVLVRPWRVAPTDAELRSWEDYFRRVAICDTRWFHGPRCPLDDTVAP